MYKEYHNTIIMSNWLTKYTPSCIDECFITKEEKQIVIKWIKSINKKIEHKSKKKRQNCLFLLGPPGVGKTTLATILLKEYNYDILEFNASDTRTQKLIRDKLSKDNASHNIIDFMSNKKKKIAIILDEIDGISKGEKGGLTEITSIIFDKKKPNNTPYICITNTLNKKLETVSKKSVFLRINKPNDFIIKKLIEKINKNESINLTKKNIDSIVKKAQNDIRRTINILHYLNQKINHKDQDIDGVLENFGRKIVECSSYELTEKILNSYKTVPFFLENYSCDKSTINWYIYENFIRYIDKNRIGNIDTKIKNINNVYKNFSIADNYDYRILIQQEYDLLNYVDYLKIYNSSFYSNINLKKSSYNKLGKLNYSTLINKTSLEYLNSKLTSQINETFNNNSDINYSNEICNLVYLYFNMKDTTKIKELIKYYNIDKTIIEKMIKMNSIFNDDNLNETKIKIKNLYNNK